jgi:hypothetical protein
VFTDPGGEPAIGEQGEQSSAPIPVAGVERDWDERRRSQLETERWERLDRRVERYALLVIFFIGAIGGIVLAAPGPQLAISVLAGLRLRALNDREGASIWDWLIRRQMGG